MSDGSESHSSASATSDSVTLPPAPQHDGPSSTSAPPPTSSPNEPISLFIGLGPAARTVRQDELRSFLQSKAMNPENVLEVRLRGRCAFADIRTTEESNHLISQLDGQMFEDRVRLAVQVSKHKKDERPAAMMRERRRDEESSQCLFIGLGPNGARISTEEVKQRIEAVCPVRITRRRDQCMFVEVDSHAQAGRVIDALNNQHIGDSRLSVQFSRDNRKRDHFEMSSSSRGLRRDDRPHRSDERRRYRSRSNSRDRDRYHRRRRYSDDSREERRGGRGDDRRPHRSERRHSRRSRSYSSSYSASASSRSLSSPRSNDSRRGGYSRRQDKRRM